MFITENGWSDAGELDDDDRIEYLHDHLENVLDVVLNDESNLKGYTGLQKNFDGLKWFHAYIFSKIIYSQYGQLLTISNGLKDIRKFNQLRRLKKTLFKIIFLLIFSQKFGLYSVNFSSPRRERTAKKSAHFMQAVASTRRIPKIN